jgi:hypothetical protein
LRCGTPPLNSDLFSEPIFVNETIEKRKENQKNEPAKNQ